MADTAHLEDVYRDLHAHPELGFAEIRTAGVVAAAMRELGLDVTEHVGGTGVVAVLENGDGPTVWLRADMDALPLAEQTGLEYASTVTATTSDGETTPVAHACGHDMHVTWLIGAMQDLVAEKAQWMGTVVAIFQPAEEPVGGALAMVADGLTERFPSPSVVLGQHVAPLPAGTLSVTAGTVMAATDSLSVTFHGRGGHGSRPETTTDPVLAAAASVVRLQSVVSREVTPGELAVLTVGSLHAGSKSNIIPAESALGINIRTVSPGIRDRVLAAVARIVGAEATASGMTTPPTIETVEQAPATVNDDAAAETVRKAFVGAFGAESVIDFGTVSGSEDVGHLATAASAPLVFWLTGGADPEAFAAALAAGTLDQDVPSNHSPHFAPVLHPTIGHGVDALVAAARAFLLPL